MVSSTVVAEMAGEIACCFVRPGQWVATGERLITIEAAKCEYVVGAPSSGKVLSLLSEGSTVKIGDGVGLIAL